MNFPNKHRYYYLNTETNVISIYWSSLVMVLPPIEFLGSTDNPLTKMACSAFLKGQSGYKIQDNTKGTEPT